jgi:ribosomal protein L7/L12
MVLVLVLRGSAASARVARIERKLDMLLKHSGVDAAGANAEMLAALVREGKKIEAIKLYREMTGCGLAEAKEHVESLESGTGRL